MKKLFVSLLALTATMTLSAQDLSTLYNEAAAAFGAKDFAGAAAKFEELIALDPDGADEATVNAKKSLPKCYRSMGSAAMKSKDYAAAAENFAMSIDLFELYGAPAEATKTRPALAQAYQAMGVAPFNDKDFATAAEIFAKGYEANPRNTDVAINLATCYCETGEFVQGMEIFETVAALNPQKDDKTAAAVARAQELISLYTNNQVAKMQAANDFDGLIAMAEELLAKNPASPLALSVQLQAYNGKKDYAKVIELGETAAEAQTTAEAKSQMYYLLGAAYNAKEMKPQAIAAFQKVTAGPNAANAKTAVAELSK